MATGVAGRAARAIAAGLVAGARAVVAKGAARVVARVVTSHVFFGTSLLSLVLVSSGRLTWLSRGTTRHVETARTVLTMACLAVLVHSVGRDVRKR
jgi:hypothetical protein